jgi:CIC family chloride channel protein
MLGGALGVGFNRALLGGQAAVIEQKRIPRWALPGIAGVLVGLVAWWLPDAVGGGQGVAERVLGGTMSVTVASLVLLLVAKFALSVVSYASGAPGGIFAPMLLLGALLGAAFAKATTAAWPSMGGQEQALAVLGMAAIFVGSVRAPLTGIVLISEMTDGYQLLFPVCIAALGAYLTAEAFRTAPIYDSLLEADLRRAGHGPSRAEPRSVYIGIQSGSLLAGNRIADSRLPRGCLIIAVERRGSQLLPSAGTVLLPGDHITILAPGDAPDVPLEIVRLCTGM